MSTSTPRPERVTHAHARDVRLPGGLGVVGVPWLLRQFSAADAEVERLEALQDWVRRTSDVLAAGGGLVLVALLALSGRWPRGPLAWRRTAAIGALAAVSALRSLGVEPRRDVLVLARPVRVGAPGTRRSRRSS